MYQWSDEDLMFRDALRGFIDKELKPHVDQLESGALPPFDIIRKMYATFGLDEMAREGLEKTLAREEAGTTGKSGGGFSGAGSMGVILNSELAGISLGLVASMGVSLGLTVGTIRTRGTLAQKKRWLPELVTMEKVGAWAITEPDSGSDAFGGMKSYVRRDGADYILNGRKTFITNGPYADVTVVYAKLDEEDGTDRRDRKVLTFVLDKGMPGFVQSAAFKKMGMNSSPPVSCSSTMCASPPTVCSVRPRARPRATERTVPKSLSRPSASASHHSRWASSTNVTGSVWITRSRASCGVRRSGSSSSFSSSWPRWRSLESMCRTWCSTPSSARLLVRRFLSRRHRR